MSWTDDRVETLKKLWAEGLSASQIAGRLGGVSRNAVIGKVHRLGLSGRATTSRNKQSSQRARIGTIKRPPRQRFAQTQNPALKALYSPDALADLDQQDLDIPAEKRVKLVELTESCCRFPIGDPQSPEFGFCNRKKADGLIYCETHARRAFQPPQARRRDERPAQATPVEPPKLAASTPEPEKSGAK
ncbi:MAG: GcrA family cell cycle regulator [Pseudomonadota bacterium]